MHEASSQAADLEKAGLYLVMTDPLVGYEECARAAAGEGTRIIQLRMKNVPVDEYVRTAQKFLLLRPARAVLLLLAHLRPLFIREPARRSRFGLSRRSW